jgi:hypothetical protein
MCSMIMYGRRYETTINFIGFIWRGRSIIGVDITPEDWAICIGPFWVSWYQELD